MLSYLKNALNVDAAPSATSCRADSKQAEPVIHLNIDGICRSIPNIPWVQVAHSCARTVSPLYNAAQRTLHDDVEHLARLFAELEMSARDEDYSSDLRSSDTQEPQPGNISETLDIVQDPSEIFTISSIDPEIPKIVITPCATQEQDRSCWVPYQDASFGNRLSVPMHPVLNDVFPPLRAKPIPFVEQWRFVDGHWTALLPTPEEQMQMGMFSKPVSMRRRRTYWDVRSRHPLSSNRRPSSQRLALIVRG